MPKKPDKYYDDLKRITYSRPVAETLKKERQVYKAQKLFSSLSIKQQDTLFSSISPEKRHALKQLLRGRKKRGILGIGIAIGTAIGKAQEAYAKKE